MLLVASLGGAPKNPVWYYNLVAHPDITIQVGTDRRRMRARRASADEKAQLWPVVVASYPSFDAYRQKTDRDIPLMICSPAIRREPRRRRVVWGDFAGVAWSPPAHNGNLPSPGSKAAKVG